MNGIREFRVQITEERLRSMGFSRDVPFLEYQFYFFGGDVFYWDLAVGLWVFFAESFDQFVQVAVVVYDGFVQDCDPFVVEALFQLLVVFAEPFGVFFVV